MNNSTILIVEDEAIVSADIAAKLRKLGYEVVGSTSTGEEAIDNWSIRNSLLDHRYQVLWFMWIGSFLVAEFGTVDLLIWA